MRTYLTNFKSIEDVIENYQAPADALEGATVYLAWYGYGSYDGSSLVIFEKDGKLYEVNGSHCSCYGLETQWKPEETTWEALGMRKLDDDYTSGSSDAQKALTILVHEHRKVGTMKIWIVEGTTGDYSDRSDWAVCAYSSQEKAEEHASKAMHRAMEIQKSNPRYYSPKPGENEFDSNMHMDYTGTEYYTVECELKD
jgi:hypothetical protein